MQIQGDERTNNGDYFLRALGIGFIGSGYLLLLAKGINGVLFLASTNAIIMLVLMDKKRFNEWLKRKKNGPVNRSSNS